MSLRPVTRKILPVNEPWDPDLLAEELEGQVLYHCTINFCCTINEGQNSIPCDERAVALPVAGVAAAAGAIYYFRRRRTPKR